MMADWRRFRTLDAEDRALLREAVRLLVLVRVGLGAVRFPVLCGWLDGWGRCGTTGRAGARAALASGRRRGPRTAVRLGVRAARRPPRPIEAHAWVECEGAVVLGETPDLSDFVVLAAPGSP